MPHPTTLMNLTTRCGQDAVAGLNEALWAKAAGDKLLRTLTASRSALPHYRWESDHPNSGGGSRLSRDIGPLLLLRNDASRRCKPRLKLAMPELCSSSGHA